MLVKRDCDCDVRRDENQAIRVDFTKLIVCWKRPFKWCFSRPSFHGNKISAAQTVRPYFTNEGGRRGSLAVCIRDGGLVWWVKHTRL